MNLGLRVFHNEEKNPDSDIIAAPAYGPCKLFVTTAPYICSPSLNKAFGVAEGLMGFSLQIFTSSFIACVILEQRFCIALLRCSQFKPLSGYLVWRDIPHCGTNLANLSLVFDGNAIPLTFNSAAVQQ